MSTSLDRKIEAARLRAEAERRQAGGPATQDEISAFNAVATLQEHIDQEAVRIRAWMLRLLDKMRREVSADYEVRVRAVIDAAAWEEEQIGTCNAGDVVVEIERAPICCVDLAAPFNDVCVTFTPEQLRALTEERRRRLLADVHAKWLAIQTPGWRGPIPNSRTSPLFKVGSGGNDDSGDRDSAD